MSTISTPPPDILVVEDSATQAMKLRALMEEAGYRVTAVANGKLALEELRHHAPGLVITDVTMPEMDGYELCRRMREDKRFSDVPVVILTALSDPLDLIRGLQCGANHFIVKPYSDGFLLEQIRHAFANRELRRQGRQGDGLEILFRGQRFVLDSGRTEAVDLLLSSYDNAVQMYQELQSATERLRQQTAELERSNAELQQFGYVVSHDLQEPLRSVTSFLDLLERRCGNQLDEKARQYIGLAAGGAKRMHRLIQDLLAYSRVGARGAVMAPTDMEAVILNVLANLEGAIAQAGVELTKDAPLPIVCGDATLLTQLLQNLIGNAVKFRAADRPGRIHVGVSKHDGEWEFTIRDNGIGIDTKHFARIFEVFQRLNQRDVYPGSGIGLAICKKIVELHGGRIWLESTPDEGTAFHFTVRAGTREACPGGSNQ